MNIVLLEPEIPQNTGNIGRTCVATGSSLHLIKPLGFVIDDKTVRRSGLDYWQDLDVHLYENFEHFVLENKDARIFMATTKALQKYTDVSYKHDDFIMFGRESRGIPEDILLTHKDTAIRIPMLEKYRSLNLSNSVAVVLYEALRQLDFDGMLLEGKLHNHAW